MALISDAITHLVTIAQYPSGIVNAAFLTYSLNNTALSDDHSDEHVYQLIAGTINKNFNTNYEIADIAAVRGKQDVPPLLHIGMLLFIARYSTKPDTYHTLIRPFILAMAKGMKADTTAVELGMYYRPSPSDHTGRKALNLALVLLSKKYPTSTNHAIRSKLLLLLERLHGKRYARTTLTRWLYGYEQVPYVARPALYKVIVYLTHGKNPASLDWLDWFSPQSRRKAAESEE